MSAAGFGGWWYNWHLAETQGEFYVKLCLVAPLAVAGGLLIAIRPDWAGPLRPGSSRAQKIALSAVLGVTLVFSGIDFYRLQRGAPRNAPAARASGQDAEERQDAASSNKIAGYVTQCMNWATPQIVEWRTNYVRTFDEKRGPTGYPAQWFPIRDISQSLSACVQALDKAQRLQPPLPGIEATVPAYRAALADLAPLLKQVRAYYDQEDFKDDNWAKGKAMHGALMTALARFTAARKPFEDKVVALSEAIQARRLARLQKDPAHRLRYMVERSFQDAKKLTELSQVHSLAELDAAAFDERLKALEQECGDIDEYVAAHKSEADKEILGTLDGFRASQTQFLKVAKTLMRRTRDNRDFSREVLAAGGEPRAVPGHPASVLDAYNRLVDSINLLQFRK